MPNYELLYLTPLLGNETDRAAIRERVISVIQEVKGSIITAREIAKQRLSFPIRKQQTGEYVLVEFSAPGDTIKEIERELRLMPEILRILVTSKLEKARAVGAEIEAREKQAKSEQREEAPAPVVTKESIEQAVKEKPQILDDLDKKLEEILGKEMV